MKICNNCGNELAYDENFCTECGTRYENYEETQINTSDFRWHNVEEAAYRERFGVLPQLNFVNQDGFDLIQAPPVQYSKIAHTDWKDPKSAAKKGMGVAKGFLKNMGKGIMGSLEIIGGNPAQGIADLITGSAGMVLNPAMQVKERQEIDSDIRMFENRFWKERYFAMTFVPVPVSSGEEYIVQVDENRFCGFYMNSNGVYFEGLIGSEGNPIKGISIYPDKSRFVGTFNGADAEEGLVLYDTGAYYSGTFLNGMRHGKGGVFISDDYYYFGEWQNNAENGFGTGKSSSGDIYSGDWEDGKPVK